MLFASIPLFRSTLSIHLSSRVPTYPSFLYSSLLTPQLTDQCFPAGSSASSSAPPSRARGHTTTSWRNTRCRTSCSPRTSMSVVTITTAILPIPPLSNCTSAWRFEMMIILRYNTYVTFSFSLTGSLRVFSFLFVWALPMENIQDKTRQDNTWHTCGGSVGGGGTKKIDDR